MNSKKELDRKYREEQEATAFAFQEFIQTFQDTSGPPKKTFIKSGILNSKTGQEIGSENNQLYNPQPLIKSTSSLTIKNAIECARILKDPKVNVKGQTKPKSNLELLKDELKLRHLERGERNQTKNSNKEELAIYSSDSLSNDDPLSTNLFIANINPKITEQNLMQLFGAYGPLASVKIMWPRKDDKNRSTNCGFVAYMSQSDAERAMLELKNCEDMKIGWGKSVDIPASPIYFPPELLKALLPPPDTGLPFNAQPIRTPFKCPVEEEEMEEILIDSVVKVSIPLDKKLLMVVHRMIEFVVREGPLFEAMIMNREINNPSYQFLFDNQNSAHIYYRWKLYSLLQGENLKFWSNKEFRMFKNGSIWSPPLVPDYTKGMPKNLLNLSAKTKKNLLSQAQMSRFIELLQSLNMTKKKIGEVMVFCLNHGDAFRDVVDLLLDSFKNRNTKAPKKIARLYVLSDVLYNSSIKKCYAPVYHTELQNYLPEIFQQLHLTYAGLTHQFDKDTFKCKALNVLRSWDLWKIYPTSFLSSLESIFLGCNVLSEMEEDSIDGVPLDGANFQGCNVVNEMEDDSLDGVPLDGANFQGCNVVNEMEDDSLDGEPLDGANLLMRSMKSGSELVLNIKKEQGRENKTGTKPSSFDPLHNFAPSKWEIVDPDQIESETMSTKRFYELEIERQAKEEENMSKKISDHERQVLRKIEIMVLQYQDEFETGKRKLKKGKCFEREISNYRKYLLEKLFQGHKRKKHRSSSSSEDASEDEWEKKEKYLKQKKFKKDSHKERGNKKSLNTKFV